MTPDFETFLRNLPAGSFVPHGSLASAGDLAQVRDVPHAALPDSYRSFVSIVGPGYWVNDSGAVKPPSELYAFDSACWEMEGFVALVENAGGVGDHIAVNPADPELEGERPVYYCGHDPFSYVRAADTFEAWVRESVQTSLAGRRRYKKLDELRLESYGKYLAFEKTRPGRRWWQFWR